MVFRVLPFAQLAFSINLVVHIPLIACYRTVSIGIDRDAEEEPDVIKAIVEDAIVWVHTDRGRRILLVDEHSRLSGIVDWEDSGRLPKHR